jgi:hypothetical protein
MFNNFGDQERVQVEGLKNHPMRKSANSCENMNVIIIS